MYAGELSKKIILNLQNLRFYQRSSKNMNNNMFCTKIKLLTHESFIVSYVLLVQIAVKLRNSQI